MNKEHVQGLDTTTFLVSVNVTKLNHTCLATVKTPPAYPNTGINDSLLIKVGDCDSGYIRYYVGIEGMHIYYRYRNGYTIA